MAEYSHQLAAILFADIVGYTAMMQENEEAAVKKVNHFRETLELIAEELNGKIIQYYGDGSLLLFGSATNAAEFAKILQEDLQNDPYIPVRIGIHMGDVLIHGDNIFGDVVNIASRIQALAPVGGIYISENVYRNIANKKDLESCFVAEEKLKNVTDPVRIYEILTSHSAVVLKPESNIDHMLAATKMYSIAVLPFSNLSSDKQQDYFSDGLTEDIITQLSKIKTFKVISRTSVMQYKHSPKSIREIGKELGTAMILEGSVQRNGDQVRITAQLINASTDEHVWADSFDKSIQDIFAIQREVALAIAKVLYTNLSLGEARELDSIPTSDLQAYENYLRGKLLLENRDKGSILVARENFQKAVARDTSFAAAFSGLANTYLLSSYRGYEDPVQMLWEAKKFLDTAIALDPNSGETQATLGYWYFQSFDFHAAELTYRRAINLNRNQSNVYLWLAILLQGKGEMEESIRIFEQGAEINPMWDYLLVKKVSALAGSNQKDAAIALQRQLIAKAANEPIQYRKRYAELARLHWSFNNKSEALLAAITSGDSGLVRFIKDGDYSILQKSVDSHYDKLATNNEYVSQLWMGIDYARAGAREKALACFNNAIALKEAAVSLLLVPDFEFLNIKYLNLALVTRKVKQLINF